MQTMNSSTVKIIQAIIFDMDGLMIETEHLQSQAYEQVLRSYGVNPEFNNEGVVHRVGISGVDNFIFLKQKYNIDESIEVLLDKKQTIYRAILSNNIVPKPGLLALIETMKNAGLKLAVASSSSLEDIMFVLKHIGITDAFEVVVSGENVTRHKPAPDIFIEAARRLNINPENCVVLEDSQSGVEAANAAHMKVIAVPNRYTKSQDFKSADMVVTSLEKVTIAQILG